MENIEYQNKFERTYPLSFHLLNDDDEQVLKINENGKSQQLKLQIKNYFAETLTLSKDQELKLVFRPGILFNINEIIINDQNYLIEATKDSAGFVYLTITSSEDINIDPTQIIIIAIDGINIDGSLGSRNTNVNFQYTILSGEEEISGNRVIHLNVMNAFVQAAGDDPSKIINDVIFHFDVVGSNKILNDGKTANALKLHINNLSKEEVLFNQNSKFILSFDSDKNNPGKNLREWALGDANNIDAIVVSQSPNWVVHKIEGSDPSWEISPNDDKQKLFLATDLDNPNYLEINLTNIITNYPTGGSNIYLKYLNIPGCSDGYISTTIEKTPLITRGQNVGILTDNPQAALDVNGLIKTSENYIDIIPAEIDLTNYAKGQWFPVVFTMVDSSLKGRLDCKVFSKNDQSTGSMTANIEVTLDDAFNTTGAIFYKVKVSQNKQKFLADFNNSANGITVWLLGGLKYAYLSNVKLNCQTSRDGEKTVVNPNFNYNFYEIKGSCDQSQFNSNFLKGNITTDTLSAMNVINVTDLNVNNNINRAKNVTTDALHCGTAHFAIANADVLNGGRTTVNVLQVSNEFIVLPGMPVKGVPIVDFQSQLLTLSNITGRVYQQTISFTFPGNVLEAEAAIKGYDVHFGNGDHHMYRVMVSVDNITIAGNVVNVLVDVLLRDASGNIDDPYTASIKILAIVKLQNAY